MGRLDQRAELAAFLLQLGQLLLLEAGAEEPEHRFVVPDLLDLVLDLDEMFRRPMSVSSFLKEVSFTLSLIISRSRVMPSRSASRSGESPRVNNSVARSKAWSASKVAVIMYMPGRGQHPARSESNGIYGGLPLECMAPAGG